MDDGDLRILSAELVIQNLQNTANYDAKGMLLHTETWPFRVQKYAFRKNENGNNKECCLFTDSG